MSYDITICSHRVKPLFNEQGHTIFEQLPDIPTGAYQWFQQQLEKRGYKRESDNEFVRFVGSTPIQVSIFDNQIGLSIPYWSNATEAIFEALMLVAELIEDHDQLIAFDPQNGKWIT